MKFDTKPLSAGLHFVSTPIGSARDMTLRGLDVLAGAGLIAAEDTRTARKLMEIHGVALNGRQVIAYHDHSGDAVRKRVVEAVRAGQAVAYVSEAGTPLVADPGYALGRAVIEEGLPVFAAPGASAVLAALTVSGLPTDQFAFVGFLPVGQSARQSAIAGLRDLGMTVVMYESPKRVRELLGDFVQVLGTERRAVVCRELTKKFEEVQRGTLGELFERFDGLTVKGEIVVLVEGGYETEVTDADVIAALDDAMKTARMKDAATAVAGAFGLPRRQVYQMALGLSRGSGDGDD